MRKGRVSTNSVSYTVFWCRRAAKRANSPLHAQKGSAPLLRWRASSPTCRRLFDPLGACQRAGMPASGEEIQGPKSRTSCGALFVVPKRREARQTQKRHRSPRAAPRGRKRVCHGAARLCDGTRARCVFAASRLLGPFLLVTIVQLVAAALFVRVEGWEYGTAFYHCCITATTIGYGDISIATELGVSAGPASYIGRTPPACTRAACSALPQTLLHIHSSPLVCHPTPCRSAACARLLSHCLLCQRAGIADWGD